MSLLPPPSGWHLPERAPTGELLGKLDPKEQERRQKKFEDGIKAFEEAAAGRASDVKIQIEFPATLPA